MSPAVALQSTVDAAAAFDDAVDECDVNTCFYCSGPETD
jgi:hypothetical protein